MENTGETGNPVKDSALNNPPAVLAEIRSKVIRREQDIKRYSGEAAAREDRLRTMFGLRPNYEAERKVAAPERIIEMMEQSAEVRNILKRGPSYQGEVTIDHKDVTTNFHEASSDNGRTSIGVFWVEAQDELTLGEDFKDEGTDVTVSLGKPQDIPGYQRQHFPYDIEVTYTDTEGSRSGIYKSNGQSYSINEQDLAIVTDALARAKTVAENPNR